VNYLVTNDVAKLVDGQALYTCAATRGTILDDLIVYRAAPTASSSSATPRTAQDGEGLRAGRRAPLRVRRPERRDGAHRAAGAPRVRRARRAGSDAAALSPLKSFHFRDAVVANVRAPPRAPGYTGEDGVEIFCAWTTRPRSGARSSSRESPRPQAAGLGARDTLRLEARLSLYGNDIDETTNPLEAGLGWVVKMDKGDFVGRARSRRIKAAAPRKLVGFEVGRGIARHGYPLRDVDGAKSASARAAARPHGWQEHRPRLFAAAMSAVGTRFLVDCRGKNVEAVVVKTPFYKEGNKAEKVDMSELRFPAISGTRRTTSGRSAPAARSPSASPRSRSSSSATSRS
jgi:aminomethyltransferase